MGSKGKEQEGGGRSVAMPAPFLTKTYQMVEDEETEDVITWGQKGVSFVVRKPVEFARDLLPVHFKHNNFSSFVRQLNTYGFRKVVADRWEFANDNFRRGEQTLLSFIRRRKSSSLKQPPPSSTSGQNSAEIHSSSSASSPPLFLNLSSENEKLRRENKALNTELAQAKRHCEELLGFLSKYVDVGQLDLGLLMKKSIEFEGGEEVVSEEEEEEEEEDKGSKKEASLKLFGVLLKVSVNCDDVQRSRKRRRCDGGGGGKMPAAVGVSSPVGGSSNVSQ